jgi:Iap family predicted aminopeptidase
LPRRRAIRLISFGAEEQLSVGSAVYARRNREELERRGRLMFNLDSYGSWMGWCTLVCNGPPELNDILRSRFEAEGVYARCLPDIMPYADHFPFVAAGVPGVTLLRENCDGGRFFHHQPDDDMSRVSTGIMARQLIAVAGLLADLATCEDLPFKPQIPDDQSVAVKQFWEDLFGGW